MVKQGIKKALLKSELGRVLVGYWNGRKNMMPMSQYRHDREIYEKNNSNGSLKLYETNDYIIRSDLNGEAGAASVYLYQDLLVSRLVYENNPDEHYDIGSRLDGFLTHLLSFRTTKKTVMIDIRPLEADIPGLGFVQANATDLSTIPADSIESLSSLHAVEHFGLGRYGDPIDPDACFKAMKSMQRVLRHGGVLYFAVPCGKVEKVCFNAHRIFSPYTITRTFDRLELEAFYYVDGKAIYQVSLEDYKKGNIQELLPDDKDGWPGIFVFRKTD